MLPVRSSQAAGRFLCSERLASLCEGLGLRGTGLSSRVSRQAPLTLRAACQAVIMRAFRMCGVI